jgi:hypothetical protein
VVKILKKISNPPHRKQQDIRAVFNLAGHLDAVAFAGDFEDCLIGHGAARCMLMELF